MGHDLGGVGLHAHEQRAMEMFRVSKHKRVHEFIKKRVGTQMHANRKQEELSNVLVAMRKARAEKD